MDRQNPFHQMGKPRGPLVYKGQYLGFNWRSRIRKGLDKGRSWEDIAKKTGISVDSVKNLSQVERPNYGMSNQPSLLDRAGDVAGSVVDAVTDLPQEALQRAKQNFSGFTSNFSFSEEERRKNAEERTKRVQGIMKRQEKAANRNLPKPIQEKTKNISLQDHDIFLELVADEASDKEINSFLDKAVARKAADDRKVLGAAIEAASLGFSGAGIGAAARAGGKAAAAKAVASTTASGVTGGAGYELRTNPDARAEDIIKSGLVGGGMGLAGSILGFAAGSAISKARGGTFTGAVGQAETKEAQKFLRKQGGNLDDVTRRQIEAAITEKNKYRVGTLRKITDAARREIADPLNRLQREDYAMAKALGVKYEDLVAKGRSLPELMMNSRYHSNITNQFFNKKRSTGRSVAGVISHWGEGTTKSQEFNAYLNKRFALEVLNKTGGKKQVLPEFTAKELKDSIALFEKKYGKKAVQNDAKTIKENMDELLDYAADAKVISKADSEFVKKHYKNYAPIERVFSEDLVRPKVSGGISTNVGKQRIIQSLEGSGLPADVSFETVVKRTDAAIGQSLKNKLDVEILERQKAGLLKGNLVLDPETTKLAKSLREQHKKLVAKKSSLRTELGRRTAQLRTENAYTLPIRKEAVKTTRDYLKNTVDNPDARGAINELSDKDLMEVFQGITGDKEIDVVRSELIKKGKKTQHLVDDLERLRAEYNMTDKQRAEVLEDAIDLRQDGATGKNLVVGQLDGEKFAIEVNKDFADALAYLNNTQKKDFMVRALQAPANIQKTLFTGPLAPIFQLTQVIKNQGIMFTNGRRLSPFGARAIAEAVRPSREFSEQLVARGALPETFTKGVSDTAVTASRMAAKGNIKALDFSLGNKAKFIKDHPVQATKDFFAGLNRLGAFFGNRQRAQVARGSYQNAINRGFNKEEALNIAARDFNEVIGNFNRVSKLAQAMEPIILYSGATQSGARSLFSAWRKRPVETSLKITALAGGLGAMAANNLSTPEGREYYRDMYKNKKSYNIDNFITFVQPGAHKDPTTGQWSGIWKLPIAPDFRPLSQTINRGVFNDITTDGKRGADPKLVAENLFNSLTGGVAQDSNQGGASVAEILKNNPTLKVGAALGFNKDIETGREITKHNTPGTSDFAKETADKLSSLGINVTPNQVDAVLGQGGLSGRLLQNRSGNLGDTLLQSAKGQFKDSFSRSAAGEAFEAKQKVLDKVPDSIRAQYEARHTYDYDKEGNIKFDDSMFFQEKNAAELLESLSGDKKLYRLEKKIAEIDNKKTGKPLHPVYKFGERIASAALLADLADAGIKGSASGERKAIFYNQPYYGKYSKAITKYYKQKASWAREKGYDVTRGDVGPQPSKVIERKLDKFNTLPQNDGPRGGNQSRRLYLEANSDVTDFFDRQRVWKNYKRRELAERLGIYIPEIESF